MPISTLNIDRSDIIATFHRGEEFSAAYHQIKQLQQQGFSLREIMAQCTNLGTGEALRAKVRSVVSYGRVPRSVQAVEHLEAQGLLPMTPENSKFELFNMLVSIAFAHGTRSSVGNSDSNTASNTRITVNHAGHFEVASKVLRALGDNDFSGSLKKGYLDVNLRMGRMMEVAGYPVGAKIDRGLALPFYIDQALEDYCDNRHLAEERQRLLPVLRDFIHTFLYYRGLFERGHYYVNLNSFETQKKSREQATKMKCMVHASFPFFKPVFGQPKRHPTTGTYYQCLSMGRGRGGVHPETIEAGYRDRIAQLIG